MINFILKERGGLEVQLVGKNMTYKFSQFAPVFGPGDDHQAVYHLFETIGSPVRSWRIEMNRQQGD